MGDFTTSVRLFSGRLDPPAFVDQRLIQLNPLDDVDIGLCHALLNSSIGMFIIEALGFGRALGALDLKVSREAVYESLRELVSIRLSVNN